MSIYSSFVSLLGSPGTRMEMWFALERLYDEGKVKAIGVQHVEEMKGWRKVWPPLVDQLEVRVAILNEISSGIDLKIYKFI